MSKTIPNQNVRRIPENQFYDLVAQAPMLLKTEEGVRRLAGVASGGKEQKDNGHYTALHYALSDLSARDSAWKDKVAGAVLLDLFRDPKRRTIVARTKTDDGYTALESALNDNILKELGKTEEGMQFLASSLRGTNTGNSYLRKLAKIYGATIHSDEIGKFDTDRLMSIIKEAKAHGGSSIHIDDYGPKQDARTMDLSEYARHIGAFGVQTGGNVVVGLRVAINEEAFDQQLSKEKLELVSKAVLTDYWSLHDDFERYGAMPLFGAVQSKIFGAYYAAAAIEHPTILDVNLGQRSSDQEPLQNVYNRSSYTLAHHIAVHAPLHVAVRLVEKLNETKGEERRSYLSVLSERLEDNVCDSFEQVYRGPSVFETLISRLRESGPPGPQLANEYEKKFGAEIRAFDRGKGIEFPTPPLTEEAESTRGVYVKMWGLDEILRGPKREGQKA